MCFLKVSNSEIKIPHQAQEIAQILVFLVRCVFLFYFHVVIAAAVGFVCFHLLFSLLLEVLKVVKERAIYNV